MKNGEMCFSVFQRSTGMSVDRGRFVPDFRVRFCRPGWRNGFSGWGAGCISRAAALIAMPLVFACFLAGAARANPRTWTDVLGRKIEATMVSATDTEVVLKLANGRNSTVPLEKLSDEDQKFVRSAEPVVDGGTGGDGAKQVLNFNMPWPKDVRFNDDPRVEVIDEDKDSGRFVYESNNYRFICDVRLSKQVVKGFSVMFESTYEYCRSLPLAISDGVRTDGKFQILLFETEESYFKAGGLPGSAGVFVSGRNVVMVPLTSLGVRRVGSGYMLDRDASSGTLIHEITHQLTPLAYYSPGAMGWFSEGIAEYTTSTPYRAGRFKVRSNFDDIVEYATAFGKDDSRGRALGKKIKAPALRDFMFLDYRNFTGGNANFNYGFGLILTTYFLHLDGDGDAARIKEFLQALRDGKEGEDAILVLLGGRDYKTMEKQISDAWKRKGIEIEFGAGTSVDD